jgi:hypothetical protein
MSSSFTFFNKALDYLWDGTIDLDTDAIKIALVTSAYTPNVAHEILAEVLSSPSPELEAVASPSNGYTAGGAALTGKTITQVASPLVSTFDAADLTWTALTGTFRYGIMYADKSVGSPAIVDPLIGYILFDTTPADITVSGIDYTIQWNASGIFTLTKAA